jgi:hypothetical protein
MSKTTNTNMTGLTSPGSTFNRRISADSDQFDRNDVDAVGMALDDHDHDVDQGLGVARIQTGTAPTAAGNVRVNGDVFQWWANSAGSVYSAVSLAGTQTITGSKTFSSAINLTSGQIMFPATQAASADANTLDDYEEGTWTPSIGGTATYTLQTGTYTKIGRHVHVFCDLRVNVIGTGSTSVISGLPFTAARREAVAIGTFASLTASVYWIGGYIPATTTTMQIIGTTAAATGSTDPLAVLQNGSIIIFSAEFEV